MDEIDYEFLKGFIGFMLIVLLFMAGGYGMYHLFLWMGWPVPR